MELGSRCQGLTHSPAFSTSPGHILRYLLPSRWCPRTHLASPGPDTPALALYPESSRVAVGESGRRGLICAVSIHAQRGSVSSGVRTSGRFRGDCSGSHLGPGLALPWPTQGLAEAWWRQASYAPRIQVPSVLWCTGSKIPEGHPSAVDWGDTPVRGGTRLGHSSAQCGCGGLARWLVGGGTSSRQASAYAGKCMLII